MNSITHHPHAQKENFSQFQSYRTTRLISHTSKIILRAILNSLKNEAEELVVEEQNGFRSLRTTGDESHGCLLCPKLFNLS